MRSVQTKNLYTFNQVKELLGISPSSLGNLVEKGIIKKIIPPGKKNGYYTKTSVDNYKTSLNVFVSTYEIETIKGTLNSRLAKFDEQEKIFELESDIYGGGENTVPLNIRKEWFKQNACIDYICTDNNEIFGHISLLPLKMETITQILEGKLKWPSSRREILKFEAGNQYNLFVMSAAVKNDPVKHLAKLYPGLITRCIENTLIELASESKMIRKVFATSRSNGGIAFANRFEFKVIDEMSTPKRKVYVMEMISSKSKWAEDYRKAVKELKLPSNITEGIIN